MANRLFGQRGRDFRDTYQRLLEQIFGAPLEPTDFIGSGPVRGKHQRLVNHKRKAGSPTLFRQRAEQRHAPVLANAI